MPKIFEGRRDPRYTLKKNSAFATFVRPGKAIGGCGRLVSLSVAGVCIEVDGPFDPAVESTLDGVVLRIGECSMNGRIVVKNSRALDESSSTFGGCFYPDSDLDAVKLMALITGMEAIESIWGLACFPDADNRDAPYPE